MPEWSKFAVFFDQSDIKMVTVAEAGLSGALNDPMLASGFVAALVALWLSMPLERLFRRMTHQMEQDGLVPPRFQAVSDIETQRRVLSWTLGGLIFAIMFVGITGFYGGYSSDPFKQLYTWGASFLGLAAGHRMGTAFAYGQFARRFMDVKNPPRILPGHADKTGGWRRFGEFMAYLSVIMFIPLMWLSTWIFLALQSPEDILSCVRLIEAGTVEPLKQPCDFRYRVNSSYVGWLTLHAVLLFIMVVITIVGLIRPFARATRPYRQDRARLMREYLSQLDAPLAAARARWETAKTLDERQTAAKEIGDLTGIREAIWSLPSAPLRSAVTGVFSLSAAYPVVMLVLGVFLPKDDELTGAIGLLVNVFKSLGL